MAAKISPTAGDTNFRGRLSAIDLLIKVACFVTKVKYYLQYKKQLI
jgi:hypothetical protein